MPTKFALFIFPIFLFSLNIKFISAQYPNVDKETMETINEFIELGQKVNKNPNAAPDVNEVKKIQKKWFDQEDFDKVCGIKEYSLNTEIVGQHWINLNRIDMN